jgi:DNA-binding NarL/FixJ family response regulator
MTHPGYQAPYCILTEVEMPGPSGCELIKEVRKRFENQRFIITTRAPEKRAAAIPPAATFL